MKSIVVCMTTGYNPNPVARGFGALVADPNKAPVTLAEFGQLLEGAQKLAGQLNNTNASEQAITGAFNPDEIPRTLPAAGVPRPANKDGGENKG